MDVVSGDNWRYKKCKASVKTVATNKPTPSFLQAGCMPFLLSPNQQCQSTDGKNQRIIKKGKGMSVGRFRSGSHGPEQPDRRSLKP